MSERTFTEKEHFALVADAVKREVEKATAEAKTKIGELQSALDVVEAEKAAAEAAKNDLSEEFAQFKADIEHAEQVAARREERVNRVKEVAGTLAEGYFTDERAARWAEMDEAAFTATLSDIAEVAVAGLTPEEAAKVKGLAGEELHTELAAIHAGRVSASGSRETAAFAGGVTPSTTKQAPSAVSRLLAARMKQEA